MQTYILSDPVACEAWSICSKLLNAVNISDETSSLISYSLERLENCRSKLTIELGRRTLNRTVINADGTKFTYQIRDAVDYEPMFQLLRENDLTETSNADRSTTAK